MKTVFSILLLTFVFLNISYAEIYHFKKCDLSKLYFADYFIDMEKKKVLVSFIERESKKIVQKKIYKIDLIEKDEIVTEKKQNVTYKEYFMQYFLNSKTKQVTTQRYKYDPEFDVYKPESLRKASLCERVKGNWVKEKKKKGQKQSLETEIYLPKCEGSNHKNWTTCMGKYTDENGYKYDGHFRKGQIIEGSITYPGGTRYFGKFINNKPYGDGTFTYPDGSTHAGQWKDGIAFGYGVKTWSDGRKYSGTFKQDKPDGKGTYIYRDGSKYVGEFKDGVKHGDGTLTYPDGRTYVGKFVAGHEHGLGTCFAVDGSNIECEMDISSTGKDTHNINIEYEKWIRISKYDDSVREKLGKSFDKKAYEICKSKGDFKILKKIVEIIEMDETPAFGTEAKVRIGIQGVIECK